MLTDAVFCCGMEKPDAAGPDERYDVMSGRPRTHNRGPPFLISL